VLETMQPVLEQLYSSQVAEAYKAALAKAGERYETIVIFAGKTKGQLYEKTLLVYTDGVKALVLELRSEGFLPEEGKATIAHAIEVARTVPPTVRAKAAELAEKLLELSREAPELAKAKIAELYTMALAAKEELPVVSAKAYAYAQEQAQKLMKLSGTAYELAEQRIQELYSWFLSLSPVVQEKLQAALEATKNLPPAKELAAKAQEMVLALPATAREQFPTAAEKVDLLVEQFESEVKPAAKAQWDRVALKLQQAKEGLQLQERFAGLKAKALELKVPASMENMPALAFEMKEDARAKALAVWQYFFAIVMEKVQLAKQSAQQIYYREAIKEDELEEAVSPDPLEAKFEAYMKAQGIDATEEDEE